MLQCIFTMANQDKANSLLSEMNDHLPNIYEMTRDIAKVAKQIKADTKEDIEAPKPVLEAITKIYETSVA